MLKIFEVEINKFLLRMNEGRYLLKQIPNDLFTDPQSQFINMIINGYYDEYREIPAKINLLQYIEDVKQEYGLESLDEISIAIDKLFSSEIDIEINQFKSKIIKEIQLFKTIRLFEEHEDQIGKNDGVVETILTEMGNIVNVKSDILGHNNARFVLQDFKGFNHIDYGNIYRLPFEALNNYTSVGGVFSPQIIVFMAPPKGFKTGVLVNIAVHFMRQGRKVFYADFENGEDDIINRIYSNMLQKGYEDMIQPDTATQLKEILKFYNIRGGDVFVESFEMHKGTPSQVDGSIEKLSRKGWEPDVIIWDYLDIGQPTDIQDRKKDKRFQIQAMYGEVKNINKKRQCVSITVSQTNRMGASKKDYFTPDDIGEDYGKVANADAIIGIIQSPKERQLGIGRLQPIIQRKGVDFTGVEFCYLEFHKDSQTLIELDVTADEYGELLGSDPEIEDIELLDE